MQAVGPVSEAADALGLELPKQPLTDRPLHGRVIRRLIPEQPGQIKRLELFHSERCEFGGRWSKYLHGAKLQRFYLFFVLEQLRVRINFDFNLAVGVLLGEFLELERALALRCVIGNDMAEFYDDRALSQGEAWSKKDSGDDADK